MPSVDADGALPRGTGNKAGEPLPHALRDALREAHDGASTTSESASEEDYDELAASPAEAMVLRRRRGGGRPTQLRNELPADDAATEKKKAKATTISWTENDGNDSNDSNDSGTNNATTSSADATTTEKTKTTTTTAASKKTRSSFVISMDDPKLANLLRADLERLRSDLEERQRQIEAGRAVAQLTPTEAYQRRRLGRFRDFVFTRGFSAFDRQNAAAANSPFHGWFALFWTSVFLFIVKIAATNWRNTGSPLGTNEIMNNMFHRDVVVLLASDGVLCALTGVSWLLQLLVRPRQGSGPAAAAEGGVLDWDGAGWVVQNVWQLLYVAGFIGWTQLRAWPWSHTVFFVLHGLVMLMKQHSYAFYNGYLSTVYRRRAMLQRRLAEVTRAAVVEGGAEAEGVVVAAARSSAVDDFKRAAAAAVQDSATTTATPSTTPTTTTTTTTTTTPSTSLSQPPLRPEMLDKIVSALEAGQPLDDSEAAVFARVLRWEIDALAEELRGKATAPERAYPHNLTLANHYEYIILPTVVYELEYPRAETINWRYAAEKLVAVFGLIFVMIMVSQAFIYPVVMQAVAMKEAGVPLPERFKAFPWMLSDMLFPMMMEYLLSWYLIWETILNFLAEITYFADRNFYAAWWNSVTWDEFARDWNRPVHLFLLRHVYHSSISALKVKKTTATLITFFLSACVHELVMWCIFKKLRGYLLFLQMFQLPLVRLSRSKYLRNRQTLGNVIFWLSIYFGPSLLCSLYLIL